MQRRWLAMALAVAIAASGEATAGGQATASGAASRTPRIQFDEPSESWARLGADSGWLSVASGAGSWSMRVETPAGVFLFETDSAATTQWLDSAAAITDSMMAITVAGLSARQGSHGDGKSILIRRVEGERFEVIADNGAWNGTLHLSRPAFDSLFGIVHGTITASPPPAPPTETDQPLFEFQVEHPVSIESVPRIVSPRDQAGEPIAGVVVLQCVVDETGRPLPETMRLLRSSDPRLARVARDAFLKARFYPATAGGKPVKQIVQWPFNFVR